MGMIANVMAQKLTFSDTSPLMSFLASELVKGIDPPDPGCAAAVDAVHTIAESTQTSGNCTLTITLRNGETFTTGNITFEDSAATVEGAIDTAATAASITDWTNGDISVSGTAMNDGGLVLTFDGDSVSGVNHPITVLTDVDGAGGAWGAVSITTAGQGARNAWGLLAAWGVITTTLPTQTAAASVTSVTAGAGLKRVPDWAIRELAQEAAAEDANYGQYFSIMAALGYEDRAPLVAVQDDYDVI